MAWRIHDSVIRGEIDNRERGIVRGKLALAGQPEPVLLELKGNAAADLAGCLLTFENPGEKIPMRADSHLAALQRGTIGDLTASRKVRVLEMPVAEADDPKKKGLPVPEHMANSLYLEWFSDFNGRVVIESADYNVTISPPVWRLTPDEEQQRRQQAAEGFGGFMQKLSDALEAQKHQPPENKEWDEFDYEQFMRECDARTDKYAELMDKYMDYPDRDRLIAKEMGWTWLEEALDAQQQETGEAGSAPASGEKEVGGSTDKNKEFDPQAEAFDSTDAGPPLEPDPATQGVDWVRKEDGYISHPLALRALEGSVALWNKFEELGLDKTAEDGLCRLLGEYQTTSAKLAGALDGLAYGRDLSEGAFIVACLKRALNHLHTAQAALEQVSLKRLLPAELLDSTRAEFFVLREEILRLMTEFRGQE
jgi:hypothetical protein